MLDQEKNKNNYKTIKKTVVDALEIPTEIGLNLPVIKLIGNESVLIENHQGLITYTLERIILSLSFGELEIIGENLCIDFICKEEIQIMGLIKQLNLQESLN